MRNVNGQWRARSFTWGWLDGQGFGNPVHYYQGIRAAGVGVPAGLIRKAKHLDAEEDTYHHALSITLDETALTQGLKHDDNPKNKSVWGGYTWPATSADWDPTQNSGEIPMGSRMMLPPDFDVDALPSRELLKIARTMKIYGAYVVDRNGVRTMTIEVANEPNFAYELGDQPFHTPGNTYDQDLADYNARGLPTALDEIRKGLRVVESSDGYRTASGQVINPMPGREVPLMSLRGPWTTGRGAQAPVYDTLNQRIVFPQANVIATKPSHGERNRANGGEVWWAALKPGERLRLSVGAAG